MTRSLTACTLCARELRSSESVCACGASIAWLERAPAMLRAKLGRAALGAVGFATASTMAGCAACIAYATDSGVHDAASVDGGVDTGVTR